MNIIPSLRHEKARYERLATGVVVPDASRCVQCGICSFFCPANIDVRRHAWLSEAVKSGTCLTCIECIMRCPRGVLRVDRTAG